ncbi:AraC family transcriptional regulator [Paenibacillus oenotherae]|uniref:AraC family transcriptional regulator n=1 Tax=Paenibacillus oenotherae TaxID=1435645 RepID=A0ABS7D4F8_9BACL|nr:AraC family transcriptional regulator [Paenibacillus oenotherae]MBW7474765.1 AraC family transcriptional regulator [Paenibacillus oenotherae]
MKSSNNLSDKLASYLYRLDYMKHAASNPSPIHVETSAYGLLLLKEARGDVVISGRSYPLQRHKVFVLEPHAAVKLRIHQEDRADYYYIRFHALQAVEQGCYEPAELDCPVELFPAHFQILMDWIHEMESKLRSGNSWDSMKANIIFQEMIAALFQDAVREQQQPDWNQAISVTMDYMERNYHQNITRTKLSEMAGMSADYYSRAFKKKVGKSPMEYLADIRIRQAKQSLLLTGDSFRSIAQSVGFSDEFYFSRKFKATTGRSPTSYVKKIKYSDKIASLKHLLTGHLIALGIEPYAAVINNAYPVTTRFRNTVALGDFKPDLEKLMSAKPDLIITSEFRDYEKSQKEKIYDQIAPTITLPYYQDWRDHFMTIAKIVGKDNEASDWLERYECKAEKIQKQLKARIGDETILVVGIGEGRMCVYGQRNIGTVLYGDLKLGVPRGVAEIDHYKEIATLEELAAFEGDRILLTSFQHDGTAHMDSAIRSEVQALWANQQWLALKAVSNRAVYAMYDSQHLYTCYTSLTHDLFLDKAQQLLMSDSSKCQS